MALGKSLKQADSSALEFKAQIWAAANKTRGHMDASGYKHVFQNLIPHARRTERALLPKLLSGKQIVKNWIARRLVKFMS